MQCEDCEVVYFIEMRTEEYRLRKYTRGKNDTNIPSVHTNILCRKLKNLLTNGKVYDNKSNNTNKIKGN